MTEQIEVFGQFDVRRNDDTTESKSGLTDQMSIDKARITNTFGGDQLNAALDAIDLTSKLRVAHYAARTSTDPKKREQKYYGLDLLGNGVRDSLAAGVVEPMISKLKSLKFATEAAITIIRIDDLIKLDPEEQPQ